MLDRFVFAREHGHMPSHIGVGTRAFLNPLILGIRPDSRLLFVQKAVSLDDVGRIAAGAAHRVHQGGISIDTDMRLDPEVPLVPLQSESRRCGSNPHHNLGF